MPGPPDAAARNAQVDGFVDDLAVVAEEALPGLPSLPDRERTRIVERRFWQHERRPELYRVDQFDRLVRFVGRVGHNGRRRPPQRLRIDVVRPQRSEGGGEVPAAVRLYLPE